MDQNEKKTEVVDKEQTAYELERLAYKQEILKRLELLSRLQAVKPPIFYNQDNLRSILLMPLEMKLNPIQSSNIESWAYDIPAKVLAVKFKGGDEYRYMNVKPHEAIGFNEAASKGSYFGAVIKSSKDFVKMPKELIAIA